jgi:hypothetical protein
MNYIPNPKTQGSGIISCIPQSGRCPNNCEDCFFQSGRSYLEPLDKNLPNIPPIDMDLRYRVVRVNDGNDSNVNRECVIETTKHFPMKFFNTAIPFRLKEFKHPVVLTLNPGEMTDTMFHKLEHIPKNLMFVRVRTNTWNIDTVVDKAIEYYTSNEVPVVLTFMAYFNETKIPDRDAIFSFVRHDHGSEIIQNCKDHYMYRKRTLNPYWAIRTDAWREVMRMYEDNKWVSSCGKIEGEKGTTACRFCGNCIREYFATMERIV